MLIMTAAISFFSGLGGVFIGMWITVKLIERGMGEDDGNPV
jgi:uncharacterized protein YneF (UPF0154 family)